MPELPDIEAYIEALSTRIIGFEVRAVRMNSPFLLRSVSPQPAALVGQRVKRLRRIGKRIAIGTQDDLWAVVHLMIAGRLHWRTSGVAVGAPSTLAAFEFPNGILTLTEAGSKRRAALHICSGEDAVNALDPGGIDPLAASIEVFRRAVGAENHSLKRALTDPRVLSGIGNSYSDEILHAAKLSPIAQTKKLDEAEWRQLYQGTQETLIFWRDRLCAEARLRFPEKVTAFREGMAVHGRYGLPCPRCGEKILRIRYADNETNYCPRCQTKGKVLADRGLSRLLGSDWPQTLEELETLKNR